MKATKIKKSNQIILKLKLSKSESGKNQTFFFGMWWETTLKNPVKSLIKFINLNSNSTHPESFEFGDKCT